MHAPPQDELLLEAEIELEIEDAWSPQYLTLSMLGGLCFYPDEAAARESVNSNTLGLSDVALPPTLALPLDMIHRAEHATGIDFYDGVIDIELDASDAHVRIRVGSLGVELHNVLSAINIYGVSRRRVKPRVKPRASAGSGSQAYRRRCG